MMTGRHGNPSHEDRKDPGRTLMSGGAAKEMIRWALRAAETGLVCLALLGCTVPQGTSAANAGDRKEPPASMGLAAGFEPENLPEEFSRLLKEEPRLAIAGGGALLIALVLGIGFGKRLRRSPPPA